MISKIIHKIIDKNNTKNSFLSIESFFYFLSLIYLLITQIRLAMFKFSIKKSYKQEAYVISVGNITAGGTGKTPFAIYLADFLKNRDFRPSIILRGYKGGFEKNGGIVTDGFKILCSEKEAGDEAYLIAKRLSNVPVICGKNRLKSCEIANKKFNSNVIIMDDGFSHLKIKRDLDLVLLDYEYPFGNGYCLPRGILREKKTNIRRADALIYTRSKKEGKNSFNRFYSFHKSQISLIVKGKKESENNKQFLFTGLGNNEAFYDSLKSNGFNILGKSFYDDHHEFEKKDILNIIQAAKSDGCDSFITSMKDYLRIINLKIDFPFDLIVMDASIEFFNEKFNNFLIERIGKIDKTK